MSVLPLLNVAKLGIVLPEQIHCRGDENDNGNHCYCNSNSDGNCIALRTLWDTCVIYPFNIASLSHVQLCTFTVVVIRGVIGCFRANSIILARTWHTRSTPVAPTSVVCNVTDFIRTTQYVRAGDSGALCALAFLGAVISGEHLSNLIIFVKVCAATFSVRHTFRVTKNIARETFTAFNTRRFTLRGAGHVAAGCWASSHA